MASWSGTIVIFFGLVLLKFCLSLPLMSTLRKSLEASLELLADLDFKFRGQYFDWTDIPAITMSLACDRGREAFMGKHVPNVRLTFVDRSPVHLHNFMRPYRPLVLNFISHVDEPFWTELKEFNNMARRMSWMADFLTVVVGCAVAHSKTEWARMMDTEPVNCIHHHYCMHDRKTVATFLVDAGIAGDLVYDTPSNEADLKFAASPERLYVVYRDVIIYVGYRGGQPAGYKVEELRIYLWKLYRKVRQDGELYQETRRTNRLLRKQRGETTSQFSDDDPRNPRNVVKRVAAPPGAHKARHSDEDGSVSGESGLSNCGSADDWRSLLVNPGPGILRNTDDIPPPVADDDDDSVEADDSPEAGGSGGVDHDHHAMSSSSPAIIKDDEISD